LKIAIGKPILVDRVIDPGWDSVKDLFHLFAREISSLYRECADREAPSLKIL
jgi:hypothetical protein